MLSSTTAVAAVASNLDLKEGPPYTNSALEDVDEKGSVLTTFRPLEQERIHVQLEQGGEVVDAEDQVVVEEPGVDTDQVVVEEPELDTDWVVMEGPELDRDWAVIEGADVCIDVGASTEVTDGGQYVGVGVTLNTFNH